MFDFVSYSFVADLFVFVIAHFLINASDKSSVNLNSKPTILYLIDIHSKKKSYRARLELLQAEKKRNGCKSVFTTSTRSRKHQQKRHIDKGNEAVKLENFWGSFHNNLAGEDKI